VFVTLVVTRDVIEAGAVIGLAVDVCTAIHVPTSKSVDVVVVTELATPPDKESVPTTSTAVPPEMAIMFI